MDKGTGYIEDGMIARSLTSGFRNRGPNRRSCFLTLLLSTLGLLGCNAGSVAFREGRKAELRKDWDTALIDYQKALRDQPENAQLLISESARTQSSVVHLTRDVCSCPKIVLRRPLGNFREPSVLTRPIRPQRRSLQSS